MKSQKIISNTAYYSISSLLQMGIGFLLLPVYTRFLTPEDYGKLSVITAISTFLSQLIVFSLDAAASRFHFSSKVMIDKAVAWGSIITLVLINSFFWGAITIIFHEYIIDPFAEGIDFSPLFLLAIIGTVMSPLYLFYQQWLRTIQNGLTYIINAIISFSLTALLNLICLIYLNLGLLSLILSNFVVTFFFFIYSLWQFSPHVIFKFDINVAKRAVKYSIPLLPHKIASFWIKNLDRVLLNNMIGATAAGLFSVGNQIGTVINVVCDGINKAFSPWCFQMLSERDENEFNKLYIFADTAILLCSLGAFLISFFSPEVIILMTERSFSMAWMPVSFICFGYVANALYCFFCQPLFYYKTKFVFYASLISLIVNVISNMLFIPYIGIIGAGLSFFISMMTIAILSLLFSLKVEPRLKFHYNRMILMCVSFLLISQTVFVFQNIENLYYRFLYKIAFSATMIIVMLYLKRDSINLYIHKMLSR